MSATMSDTKVQIFRRSSFEDAEEDARPSNRDMNPVLEKRSAS